MYSHSIIDKTNDYSLVAKQKDKKNARKRINKRDINTFEFNFSIFNMLGDRRECLIKT